ncbi:MAG: hypothetical protein GX162_02965 [Firmicutes bacterium]|nr:hypothetical protein [Bacillota bacterium]
MLLTCEIPLAVQKGTDGVQKEGRYVTMKLLTAHFNHRERRRVALHAV